MKFGEAMELMKKGSKVTRLKWGQGIYFQLVDGMVQSFESQIRVYSYDDEIMISEGWVVDDNPEEHPFYDIIPYLISGSKARLKNWKKDTYIYIEKGGRTPIIHTMERTFRVTPDLESFIASDWVEVE